VSTTQPGSYRIGEAQFGNVSLELERLRIQAEVLWTQERRVLPQHGLRDGANVLEVGCGPGFVTRLLLESFPRVSVTGLDADATMLAHARDQVGDSDRVRIVEASATATGLPDAAFDIVLARFLLQHLPNVDDALVELRRVLAPGGRLIVVDADFAFSTLFEPEPPFTRELIDAVIEGQRRRGGDPHIGRKLPRLLREAGFSNIAVDAVVAHSVVVGRAAIRGVIPDQALDYLEAAALISSELAAEARGYLARIDSGEQDFEGMEMALVISGSVAN
jgi:ubiquinone/menaquinone biosynthesis C-methylase UbiE